MEKKKEDSFGECVGLKLIRAETGGEPQGMEKDKGAEETRETESLAGRKDCGDNLIRPALR